MRFVLLGEQATGKSSLLVALYGALVNHRAGEMRIARTVDDVEFLSNGLEAFGRRESVWRTESDTQARLSIEVVLSGASVALEVPDRSGDMLKHMLDRRIWDPGLEREITEASGAMLFLRADQLTEVPGPQDGSAPPTAVLSTLTDIQAGTAPPNHDGDGWDSRKIARDSDPEPWSPALMPTDARAVDLLQAVLEQRAQTLPVVVIVSAWDRAADDAAVPRAWLAEHVPLLEQFLANHDARLPHTVFGVSAQGGEFSGETPDPAQTDDPWDRAYVIAPDGSRATFAEPLAWLVAAAG